LVAEGDNVVVRFIAIGTHRGEMAGIPPTGNQVSVKDIDIFRLDNGKVTEFWLSWDQLGMIRQLGVIPMPGEQD
jgi:predicted ester cyclase